MFIGENTLYGTAPTVHVEADTNYDGGIGCQVAMVESYQNEFEFLKGQVVSDVKEYAMIKESASEEEIAAMQEGTVSSVWNKLKELVKKVIAKVKGIFKAFIARLEAFMGKNGHAFYTKYEKVLHDGTDISKLKFKYAKPKKKFDLSGSIGNITLSTVVGGMGDDDDASDIEDKLLDQISGGVCKEGKSVAKDLKESFFEDEEEVEAKNTEVGSYCQYIMDKTSVVTAFEKVQRTEETAMNKWVAEIDKAADNIASNMAAHAAGKTDSDKEVKYRVSTSGADHDTHRPDSSPAHQRTVAKYQRAVGAASRALNAYNSAAMGVAKFGVAQSRRIAAIIVAYKNRHKGSKNEAFDLYLDTVAEAAEYNTLTELESL